MAENAHKLCEEVVADLRAEVHRLKVLAAGPEAAVAEVVKERDAAYAEIARLRENKQRCESCDKYHRMAKCYEEGRTLQFTRADLKAHRVGCDGCMLCSWWEKGLMFAQLEEDARELLRYLNARFPAQVIYSHIKATLAAIDAGRLP